MKPNRSKHQKPPQTKRMKRAKGGSTTRRPRKEILEDLMKRRQGNPTRRPKQSKPGYDKQKRLPRLDELKPAKKPKKSKPKFKDNPEDRFGKYRRQEA